MTLHIGYFADGPWSHKAFDKIISDKEIKIEFICVRYDTQDTILKDYCNMHNIPYLLHRNINSPEFIKLVSKFSCDLFVSMSFNQIFRKEIITLPRFHTINCHAGKLPFYRGRNILNWALINDETDFGITVHYMDEGIDTGDIILQRCYPITDADTYQTLLEVAYIECANILYDAIILFKKNMVRRTVQTDVHPVGFYCSQRKFGDENIHWNQDSRNLFNFVRAICTPGPQARTHLNGSEMKINKVEYIADAPTYNCTVGAILQKSADGFLVKTKDSFIKVIEYEYDNAFRVGDRFNV